MRCVNENRKKRNRLLWQAANHGCHCFDRAFLLAGACVCCVKFSVEAVATMIGCLPTQALAFLAVFVYATHATQAIAFEWKPDFTFQVYRLLVATPFSQMFCTFARQVDAGLSSHCCELSGNSESSSLDCELSTARGTALLSYICGEGSIDLG